MATRPDGSLEYVIGRSRCGKTTYLQKVIQHHKRILVWDIEGQWAMQPGFTEIGGHRTSKENIEKLIEALLTAGDRCWLAYQPTSMSEFESFCQCAFVWGQDAPCAIVAEELADVSSQGKAPMSWGILIRRGMKYGISTYAISQRPAEADKTILGNAKVVTIFAPNTDADRDYLVKKLGVPAEKIPTADLHYLQRFNDGRTGAGKLKF